MNPFLYWNRIVLCWIYRSLGKQCFLFISVETTRDTKSTITVFDRTNSHLKTFLNIIIMTSYAFLLAMNKNLHDMLVNISMAVWNVACLSHHCCHCWNQPPTASQCWHPLFDLHKHSESTNVNGESLNIGGMVQPLLPYYQQLPILSRASIIKYKALLSGQPLKGSNREWLPNANI